MSVNPISPDVFQGGQMTDLPVFTGTLDGTELMEIVAAGAGQSIETEGVNYSITTLVLAQLLAELSLSAVVITDGEFTNPLAPYVVPFTIGRIYVRKTVAQPTYIKFGLASTYIVEPLVKDIGGTAADSPNMIQITFTGGETADGNATIPIQTPYGGYFFRPIAAINSWTLGSA